MSNLEHLLENTLIRFECGEEADNILNAIDKDPNKKYVNISAYTIYEICQYVWCNYLDNGNRLERQDFEDAWNIGIDD